MVTLIDTGRFRLRVSLALPLLWMAALIGGRSALFAVTYLCVTLHELTHAAVLRLFDLPVHRIDLTAIGAVLSCEAGVEHEPGAEAAMAFAGPAMNLLLALGVHLALRRGLVFSQGELLIRINLALALGNLLPALPLDGGHILRAAFARHMGLGRASKITAWVGFGTAGMLLGLGVYLWAVHAVLRMELLFLPVLIAVSSLQSLTSAAWLGIAEAQNKRRDLLRQGLLPIRHVAIDKSARISALLPRLAPRQYHIFTVIDETGATLGTFTEERLLGSLNAKNPLTAGEVLSSTLAGSLAV